MSNKVFSSVQKCSVILYINSAPLVEPKVSLRELFTSENSFLFLINCKTHNWVDISKIVEDLWNAIIWIWNRDSSVPVPSLCYYLDCIKISYYLSATIYNYRGIAYIFLIIVVNPWVYFQGVFINHIALIGNIYTIFVVTWSKPWLSNNYTCRFDMCYFYIYTLSCHFLMF